MTSTFNPDDELIQLLKSTLIAQLPTPLYLDADALVHRWTNGALQPVDAALNITLDDLLGIDMQKQQLINNTRQFLHGYPANHTLMTGARGTGKSSLIRALLARYAQDGLRVIEMGRDDLCHLDKVRQAIKALPDDCPNRYIVYCDDLAFDAQNDSYRSLKSVLDGALDSEQERVLIYATSNRRHLLPQYMKDNAYAYHAQGDEVNPCENIDESVSLSDRFGLWLSFHAIDQTAYLNIVAHHLARAALPCDETVKAAAIRWAQTRGGRSGRVAYQFSRHWQGWQLLSQHPLDK